MPLPLRAGKLLAAPLMLGWWILYLVFLAVIFWPLFLLVCGLICFRSGDAAAVENWRVLRAGKRWWQT